MKEKRILINSIAILLLLILVFANNPAFSSIFYAEPSKFEMHSLSAPDTDCTLIFFDARIILIHSSPTLNQTLVTAYLKQQNVSCLDYVLYSYACTSPVFPVSSFKQAYAPSFAPYCENRNGLLHTISADTDIPLGKFSITFSKARTEDAMDIILTYKKSVYRFPATVPSPSASGAVFSVKRAPDGKQSEITHTSLRDILPNYDMLLENGFTPSSAPIYISNKYTKKYHLPTCYTLPYPRSQIFFASESAAVASPFVPCKKCKP